MSSLSSGKSSLTAFDPLGDKSPATMSKKSPMPPTTAVRSMFDMRAKKVAIKKEVQQSATEAIVICIDTSTSMTRKMGEGWTVNSPEGSNDPSRLDIVKDVFANAATRIAARKLQTRVGLITFSGRSNIHVRQDITGNLEHFEKKLDGLGASGVTALWDALRKAKDLLAVLKAGQRDLKCRIVLLTDGQNNNSISNPAEVCSELYFNDIVLDAIVIGTSATADIFRMAKHTGGYAFNPKTRNLLYQIPMLETFVDIGTRPDIVKIPIGLFSSSTPKAPDMLTAYDFPPCRQHPNQNDDFIALRDADRYLSKRRNRAMNGPVSTGCIAQIMSWAGAGPSSGKTFGRGQAIHGEVKAMIKNEHDFMDVYVSESNMAFWKVVMQGPPDTPYADGTFLLYVELGDQFPMVAPTARFVTPILHPNVTKHGKVCHAVFGHDWTATTHVYQVLQHLWAIFMTYDTKDSVDPMFTVLAKTDHEAAELEIKEYVKRFATHSRASIRRDILGVNADKTSSLLSIDTYATSITDLKDNADSQSVCTDTSADTITINEKASPKSSRGVSGLASYLSSQRRPQTQMNEVPRFGRRKAFFG